MKAQEETWTTVPSVVLEEGSGRGREAEEGNADRLHREWADADTSGLSYPKSTICCQFR